MSHEELYRLFNTVLGRFIEEHPWFGERITMVFSNEDCGYSGVGAAVYSILKASDVVLEIEQHPNGDVGFTLVEQVSNDTLAVIPPCALGSTSMEWMMYSAITTLFSFCNVERYKLEVIERDNFATLYPELTYAQAKEHVKKLVIG